MSESKGQRVLKPISACPPACDTASQAGCLPGCGMTSHALLACLLLRQGPATTNAWLLSFVTSTLQDPLLNSPLLILFFNVLLPL